MATGDKKEPASASSEEGGAKATYRLVGAKEPGERIDRLVLEGSSTNPVRYIDLGGEGELTEAEAEVARKEHGAVLRKVGDADSDGEDETPKVETKEDQQLAQAAAAGGPESHGTYAGKRKS